MKKIIAFTCVILFTQISESQELSQMHFGYKESINHQRDIKISGLIFVSTSMPDQALIELASQAAPLKIPLVFAGYGQTRESNLKDLEKKILKISMDCCQINSSSSNLKWMVDPTIFSKFNIKGVPAFIVYKNVIRTNDDFFKVSGQMSLQNALKYCFQEGVNIEIKSFCKVQYQYFNKN